MFVALSPLVSTFVLGLFSVSNMFVDITRMATYDPSM